MFRWFQSVGAAGDEIAKLQARVTALEAEMTRRPGPEYCPRCAAPLKLQSVRPLKAVYSDAQWGEQRVYACPSCDYSRMIDVEFKS